jgi:cysteine desulfurase
MRDEVREVWLTHSHRVGNASSLHAAGRSVRRVVEESRESVAGDLGVRPSEVVFTAGGTEANNLAVKGAFWAAAARQRTVVLASAIEHHAVLDAVEWVGAHEGADVRWLPVNDLGLVDVDAVRTHLADAAAQGGAALATVMWANNEVGTLQPVDQIAALCAEAGVPFHSDAVQAVGQVPVRADLPGLAALTVSGHKLGAPVGVGALIAQRDLGLEPLLHGGGQERDVRSGTLDGAGIAAFAAALHLAVSEQAEYADRVARLRDYLVAGVRERVPNAVLRGDPVHRLPNNAHFTFPGCEGDALLMLLDAAGVMVSTGSACTSGVPEPSHVLLAMGVAEQVATGSLRFSLGRTSTRADVDRLLAALPAAVERAERAGVVRISRDR